MKRTTTKTALTALAVPSLLGLSALPAAADNHDTVEMMSTLTELNDSGGSGDAWVKVSGNTVTAKLTVSGLLEGAPHAQHIHIGGNNSCPDPNMKGTGVDGAIRVTDAADDYGMVKVSLTGNDADTSADAALDVDNFPADGSYTYERTFDVPDDVAKDLHEGNGVVVVHGVDHNDSGTYDGDQKSDLDDSLPAEATNPALCGALEMGQMSAPSGGVQTGGGSTEGVEYAPVLLGGGLLAAVGSGFLLMQRRRTES